MILWLGGSIVRMSTAYDIYEPFTEMELKPGYPDTARVQTVKLFSYGSFYTGIGFAAAFIGFGGLGYLWASRMKKQGWLLMALALFMIAAPWGFYEIYIDLKLFYFVKNEGITFSDEMIKELFVDRFSKLSPWALLSYFSAISSVAVIVWRPLNKIENNN